MYSKRAGPNGPRISILFVIATNMSAIRASDSGFMNFIVLQGTQLIKPRIPNPHFFRLHFLYSPE